MNTHNTPWPAGTPCWVDLSADDQDAAQAFYTALFGWEYDVQGPEYGGYAMAKKDGHVVAGLGGKMNPGQPTVWTTYLASDDLDATAAKITAAGGSVHVAPMDVGTAGRMMIALDPTGAALGSWQAGETTGFELANQPGAVVWNEHLSRDGETAKAFYQNVFGLTVEPQQGDGPSEYFTLAVNGQTVCGVGDLPAEVPAEVPAHWHTYFAIPNMDVALGQVTELGGTVRHSPFDSPFGQMALVTGPQGEPFALLQTPEQGYPLSDRAAV
jgi:uncharacterized protein